MSITKNVLLNSYSSMKKKIRKLRMIFGVEKLTLKVRFWHFLTCPHYTNSENSMNSFDYIWFFAQNLSNFVFLLWKLNSGIAIIDKLDYEDLNFKLLFMKHFALYQKSNFRLTVIQIFFMLQWRICSTLVCSKPKAKSYKQNAFGYKQRENIKKLPILMKIWSPFTSTLIHTILHKYSEKETALGFFKNSDRKSEFL